MEEIQTETDKNLEENNSELNKLNSSTVSTNENNEENEQETVNKNTKQTENIPEEEEKEDKTISSTPSTTNDDNKQNEDKTDSKNTENIHYEGNTAIYTDPTTSTQYYWCTEKEEWILKNNYKYEFEGDTHTYTDNDGIKYFWDKEKNAWFPKIDDEFMAQYQMNYGFNNETKAEKPSTTTTTTTTSPEKKEIDSVKPKQLPEKRKAPEPTWFEVDDSQNTKVYVSNLPTDITEEEFVNFMQKCGLVMRDPSNGQYKIKLYKEPGTDYLKGDALCTYIRVESVQLALNLLDGSDLNDHKIKVERAKFQMKGTYDPTLKPKTKKRKEKQKLKRMQEKLFDWRPEKMLGERGKHEKTVIVRNLFEPSIFDSNVGLILEFQEDLREECSKLGQVRKVIIYDRHPEGVAQINMSSPEEADEVVKLLNGRWFMKRELKAETWDGKTKFKIAETDAQISQRLDNWDKFLEDKEEGEGIKTTKAKV